MPACWQALSGTRHGHWPPVGITVSAEEAIETEMQPEVLTCAALPHFAINLIW
jgi:hypothetical protein